MPRIESLAGMRYALRVDGLDDVRDRLVAWLRDCDGAYLCVREDAGDNRHYHVYLEDQRSVAGVRKSLQRAGLAGGNGAYSLKPCTSDHVPYLQYCCKGDRHGLGPVVEAKHGLEMTDDAVEKWHNDYWVTNEQIQANRLKRKGCKNLTIVEKVEEECKHQGVAWSNSQLIAEVYIRMMRDARKSINTHAARAIVNAVQVLLCPDDEAITRLSEKIAYMN